MLIQVEALSHTYASGTSLARRALRGIDLRVDPGERVGIVGHTGSGKSTLVQHLAGLLEPTSGCVQLDGVAAHGSAAEARARRRKVGLAFQYPEAQLFERSVFREVAFGPRNLGLDEDTIATRVEWALALVGLDPEAIAERVPFTLSGGEMRRVALAGVLAMQPEVLLLDEPTAGLDPRGRRELLARMRTWGERVNASLIVVSHDLDALARLVERVVVLADGTVIADGPAQRVLSDDALLHPAGLQVPQPVLLLQALRKAGWKVRTDRLLPTEAAAEILQARQRAGREPWRDA